MVRATVNDLGPQGVNHTAALENDDEAAEHAARALSRIEPGGVATLIGGIPRTSELLNHADLTQLKRYAAVTAERKRAATSTSITERFPEA